MRTLTGSILFISFSLLLCTGAKAQKIEEIVFNLYTDSLKKGFYNYISVDGRFSDGAWLPLDSTHIRLSANTGHFKGNDLFIDSAYVHDSVAVQVTLRSSPKVHREVIIYIRKRGFTEPLKTSEEILNQQKPKRRREETLAGH
jgi:hypothetical protein